VVSGKLALAAASAGALVGGGLAVGGHLVLPSADVDGGRPAGRPGRVARMAATRRPVPAAGAVAHAVGPALPRVVLPRAAASVSRRAPVRAVRRAAPARDDEFAPGPAGPAAPAREPVAVTSRSPSPGIPVPAASPRPSPRPVSAPEFGP
jgi:hypothetical protein